MKPVRGWRVISKYRPASPWQVGVTVYRDHREARRTARFLVRQWGWLATDLVPAATHMTDHGVEGKARPLILETETVVQVRTGHLTAGVVVRRGIVQQAAPILAWSVGKPARELSAWAKRKGGTLVVVSRSPVEVEEE